MLDSRSYSVASEEPTSDTVQHVHAHRQSTCLGTFWKGRLEA